jgi:hypothetical protein
LLDRLWFRPIGPATPSGRVDDFAVLESDPTTFYVAMATAGVYKTTNAGTTFTPVFDNEGTGSIGAVAIAPTDANLVWVGTGEGNNRQSASWGDGIYKSTDGGRTWKNMGLKNSRGRSPRSSSIRWTSTSCMSRRSAICGPAAANRASTRPPTAA